MRFLLTNLLILLAFACSGVLAQEKGIDNQTRTIKKQADPRKKDGEVRRTFDWGGGKTKVRDRLPNPIRLPSRRDILIRNVTNVLTNDKFLIDESASRFEDGVIVTQPKIFARGPILTRNELFRYAVVPATDQIWTRGRYTLTIDVRSIDGMKNDVAVVATIEGRSENGLFSQWSTLESSGAAEEEFLTKLVEYIGGDIDTTKRKP